MAKERKKDEGAEMERREKRREVGKKSGEREIESEPPPRP